MQRDCLALLCRMAFINIALSQYMNFTTNILYLYKEAVHQLLWLAFISLYKGCSVGLIASIHIGIQRLCSGLYLYGTDICMETLWSLASTHTSIHRGCALVFWPAVAPIHRCCAIGLMATSVICLQKMCDWSCG